MAGRMEKAREAAEFILSLKNEAIGPAADLAKASLPTPSLAVDPGADSAEELLRSQVRRLKLNVREYREILSPGAIWRAYMPR